ncbi:MAG: prefoldin subunit beta [Desulfurococcales archaeon]|nr:prefoldin subunit beta [Desulfurococcales archaeon]
MVERLPPEVEAKYTKYLKIRETLETVVRERSVVEASLAEVESVLKALEALPDDVEIYKAMGFVMVKSDKESIKKELENRKEDLEIKLKVLREQEKALRSELERLEGEIRRLLGGAGAGGGARGGA